MLNNRFHVVQILMITVDPVFSNIPSTTLCFIQVRLFKDIKSVREIKLNRINHRSDVFSILLYERSIRFQRGFLTPLTERRCFFFLPSMRRFSMQPLRSTHGHPVFSASFQSSLNATFERPRFSAFPELLTRSS